MNTALLIPSYNASATLPLLLERVVRFVPAGSVVVVNDGSTDGTGAVAALKGVIVLHHAQNSGKGAALRTGFRYCVEQGFDAVITMDADLQHDPERIPAFIDAFTTGRYDIIIGSRMEETTGMPFHRWFSNTLTSLLVRLRTGAPIPDSQSGYRMIGRKVLETVSTRADGFEAETELLIRAAAAGFRFGAVPIPTIYAGEKSHMTHLSTTINFIRTLLFTR
ncbi:MAG: glycosyltransferase family 2 protein [Bacteroidetes bacterium]|nr:glycosyltransferase family 2 protein [Bacteroidota bacterium]